MSKGESFWRNASLNLSIGPIDIRAFVPLVVWIFYPKGDLFSTEGRQRALWSLLAALACIGVFYVMQRKGYTFPVLLRKFKHILRGKLVPARGWWYHRRFYD
ncbi:IcmT/TraK family protein [Herbaspirillum seropedicae]|uniref:IcmT/TraK family protein n=1 Tax=Herbaspirillum seropedicae TaxID=964 RepID=UPI0028647B3C|nr:IcmT/TraK family protein [Herbaspirillum seropedicae]MDR6398058.1 hypothetical protein [Herbaspirillum seropedicae]